MKQPIDRVTQSPMNPHIWFLDLACGHELRVVQKSRPSTMSRIKTNGEWMACRRQVVCEKCDATHGTRSDVSRQQPQAD